MREALRHHWLTQNQSSSVPLSGLTIKLSFKAHQALAKMMRMMIVEKELEAKVIRRHTLSLVKVNDSEKETRQMHSIDINAKTRKNGSSNNFQIKTFLYSENRDPRCEINPSTVKKRNGVDPSKAFLPFFRKSQSRQISNSLSKQPQPHFKLNKTKFGYPYNLPK